MQETFIRILADGAVIPIVLIGAWALLYKVPAHGRYQAYCRVLMAGITAYLFAKLIGSVFQPATLRPFESLGVNAGASFLNNPGFPSDHVLFCTAIVLAVWFETRSKGVTLLLAGLTLMVATGRVLALVHSPLDVVGGVLIAMIGALWYLQRETLPKPRRIRQWSKPRIGGKISSR